MPIISVYPVRRYALIISILLIFLCVGTTAHAAVSDGTWQGRFARDADAPCSSKEWDARARVLDGKAFITFGPQSNRTRLMGKINPDQSVVLRGRHAILGHAYRVFGQFTDGQFTGNFRIVDKMCRGTIAFTPTSTPAPASKPVASAQALEAQYWQDIQHSNNVSDFIGYMEKYPNGMFLKLAEAQIRDLSERQSNDNTNNANAGVDTGLGVDLGAYHALVIGINNYHDLPDLDTAINDAKAVSHILETDYGFKVQTLLDPTRSVIIDAFDDYLKNLKENDNLLIYYAGHGWLDEATDRGYWLPIDAKEGRRSNWISNATITDTMKSLAAKHVMIVADSCYSGTLTRAAVVGLRDNNYLTRMASKRARVAMVSGGLEPVADNAGDGNSPFAAAFIAALKENQGIIDGTRLFSQVRRPVILNAQQTPEYSDVRSAGHDGGDFIFSRRQ